MKHIINKIAKYIPGVLIIFALLTLACGSKTGEKNVLGEISLPIVVICLLISIILFFVTYIIHFYWMTQDKVFKKVLKKQIKSIIIAWVFLCICFCGYHIYIHGFCTDILWNIGAVTFILFFVVVSKYVYSWSN